MYVVFADTFNAIFQNSWQRNYNAQLYKNCYFKSYSCFLDKRLFSISSEFWQIFNNAWHLSQRWLHLCTYAIYLRSDVWWMCNTRIILCVIHGNWSQEVCWLLLLPARRTTMWRARGPERVGQVTNPFLFTTADVSFPSHSTSITWTAIKFIFRQADVGFIGRQMCDGSL
jgi:hypothetical protein